MNTVDQAVRVVERWGLLAGVTGEVANLLLIALYALALPGRSQYDWTGPASDVIGGVSFAALIPLAFAMRNLVDGGVLVRRMTVAVVAGIVLSALLVANVVPFLAQAAGRRRRRAGRRNRPPAAVDVHAPVHRRRCGSRHRAPRVPELPNLADPAVEQPARSHRHLIAQEADTQPDTDSALPATYST